MNNPALNKNNPPKIIEIINDLLSSRKNEVNQWFDAIFAKSPPFFYNSVDVRHSGFKLAPVDTNLFPAGFNNLNERERRDAVYTTKAFFEKYHNNVDKVLLFTEDHTRNLYYLDNITALITILENAGKEVQISNLSTCSQGNDVVLENSKGEKLTFKPVKKENGKIKTIEGFAPDMIIVNNDLTEGAPELLTGISQIVTPPAGFGWYQRRKTSHFDAYNNIAREFCRKFEIDPWLITTYFQHCGVVNFKERQGIECVALKIDKTLNMIRNKYEEYGIKERPYVFIKSDRGTYGMGIMTATSGEEVFEMSKNIRKKMNNIKGGAINSEVIIQEGVPTIDKVDSNPAEPMMYMIGGQPVGCIYRLNTKKDAYGNLNASGMAFASIESHNNDKRFCEAYALISKLASHAAAWECYVETYNI